MQYWARIKALSLLLILLIVLLWPELTVQAHEERPAQMPDGSGQVPTYRTSGPHLLVCKTDQADFEQRIGAFPGELKDRNRQLWQECQANGYRHLQEAVNNITGPGYIIYVLPGLYLEEPSQKPPAPACASLSARVAKLGYQVLSWEQQLQCPNNQNLVAIFNKPNLQIEGTGAQPTDVIFDAAYTKLNAIRADRSNGIYLKNLTAQHTTFNAIYIMETDGFVIDQSIGRWNDEYGFLTFADDHGLYANCEAYGNGDSGVYPGAAHDINASQGQEVPRYAIEIRGCYSHHNLLGYSGTAGDSVWAHDNRFVNNTTGVSTDSAFPNHPGLPQNHARFERNEIGDNNIDYFRFVRDGTCSKPSAQRGYDQGVVCPAVGLPVGTGVINPGGNYNLWKDNWVYGNHYAGFILTWVPGIVRDDSSWEAQFDTSHHNRFLGNKMGVTPDGRTWPNGLDFWWDGQGRDNCWQSAAISPTEPGPLPGCNSDNNLAPVVVGPGRIAAEPLKILKLLSCNEFDLATAFIPDNCDWFGAGGLARIEVQAAAIEAGLLIVAALLVWWGLLAKWRWRSISTLAGIGGAVLLVVGTAAEGSRLTGLSLLLLGGWWISSGWVLRHGKVRVLGWLSIALGIVAFLGALDAGLVMVPLLPLSPSWFRLLLELIWLPGVVVVVFRLRRGSNLKVK